MERYEGLARPFKPDWEALVATIRRQRTPRRVHNIELFQDPEISDAIAGRFDLLKGLAASDPDYTRKKRLAIQRSSASSRRAGLAICANTSLGP